MPQANPTGGANSERLENVTFPQARIDLNDNLEALQTLNSGNSEPSTKAAFMQWLDTSSDPAVLKIRNAANNAWIEVGSLSATEYASKGLTAIANGGTGQTTAAAAIAALLPSQGGNSGKSLSTDGSVLSWASVVSSSATRFDYTGSSQTWTKPTSGSFVIIVCWGGGGGGSKRGSGSVFQGGGGGACGVLIKPFSELTDSSYTVTVGVGGSAGGSSGGHGGNSSFGSLITAHGGERGREAYHLAGARGGGFGGLGSAYFGGDASTSYTAQGDDSSYTGYRSPTSAIFGGGGGGGGGSSAHAGSPSIWGGGGGAANGQTGGNSVMGGNGGNGGSGSNGAASDGATPGGGGGGSYNGAAGAGGSGRVDVYVI